MLNQPEVESLPVLFIQAEQIWSECDQSDWREAFSQHPKIGDMESLREKFASTADWASGEQSAVQSASPEVIAALAEGNRTYEEKFGYIFIVCATGKTAEEILVLLRSRLPNRPEVEIQIAAQEQLKITKLRLEKLFTS
jgi:2-oxo-4-hydroxy-4-carboxy-5-ureidoimidazoline decarboxylase